VPDEEHEALRDLTRARETAVQDQTRSRHRVSKLLLRLGTHRPEGMSAWSKWHHQWLRTVKLAQPAQRLVLEELLLALDQAEQRVERLTQALEALATTSSQAAVISAGLVTAVSLVAELGVLTRLQKARQAMAYVAVVPRESSSGSHQKLGGHYEGWQPARSFRTGRGELALSARTQGRVCTRQTTGRAT